MGVHGRKKRTDIDLVTRFAGETNRIRRDDDISVRESLELL
jgi:hypothetical protein